MKHLLIILISFLLLSSPVIGLDLKETLPVSGGKGVTLYEWETSSGGKIWKYFGDKETQPVYKGEVENGVPNGLGIMIYPKGVKYVGSWDEGRFWYGTQYDKYGNIYKLVYGEWIRQ